ncbi:MAG TPA: hypothetical protein VFY96_17975 [Candidatus Binatia bacterium]|nr:hypothetical protein [Candidatus Binatia bacterium]
MDDQTLVVTGKAVYKARRKHRAFTYRVMQIGLRDGSDRKGYIRIEKGCQVRNWSFLERWKPDLNVTSVDYWALPLNKSPVFGDSHDVRVPSVYGGCRLSLGSATGNKRVDYAKGAADCNRLASATLSKLSVSCGAGDMGGFALTA